MLSIIVKQWHYQLDIKDILACWNVCVCVDVGVGGVGGGVGWVWKEGNLPATKKHSCWSQYHSIQNYFKWTEIVCNSFNSIHLSFNLKKQQPTH